MKKFNCLVFIDDDYPTNYYHNEIVSEANVCEHVIFYERASEAFEFLKAGGGSGQLMPEIIFLDLNMPEINGWEFAELYNKQFSNNSSRIILLTTSLNPADQQRAEECDSVSAFMHKPLTLEILDELRDTWLS